MTQTNSPRTRHRRLRRPTAAAAFVLAIAQAPTPVHAQIRSLEEALVRALEVHPSLDEARATADAAAAGIGRARSGRFPGLALQGTAVRFEEPMLVAPLHRFDPTAIPAFDRTLVQGSLGLDWTLYDGGRTGARLAGARARSEAGDEGVREVEAALLQRAAESYLTLLTARELHGALIRHVVALEAERDRSAQMVAEGAAPELERLRADAELASARASEQTALQRVELARTTLALLLDLSPGEVEPQALRAPGVPAPMDLASDAPGGRPAAESFTGSPALAGARDRVAAAEAELDVARSAWLPTLSAVGGYNLFSGGGVSPVAEWQGGFRISYPVFTGGARRAASEVARATVRRERARLDALTEELELAAAAARTSEVEARSSLEASEAAVARFLELARVERLALDEGAGVQSDWLRAESGLLQSRAGAAGARHRVLAARIAWARATGRLDLNWITQLLEEGS